MGITRKRLIGVVRNEQTTLALLAIVIGLAASFGCIALRYAIAGTQFVSWGMAGERLASHVAELSWWVILIVPTLGGLAVGLLRRYVASDQRFHGVADVVEASTLRGGRVGIRDGLVAAAGSALSLGVGGSAGREGPAVHLGAMFSSLLAQRFGLQRSATMTLLGCGVASAVATSFNAPIAGVFFALEVVVGHYGLTAFAPVVLASVVGTIVTRIHYGDFPAFIMEEHVLVSLWEVPAFAILGIVAAGVAWAFMNGIALVQDAVARWKVPIVGATMSGGLLVGLIALVLPEVLGVGYEATLDFPSWLPWSWERLSQPPSRWDQDLAEACSVPHCLSAPCWAAPLAWSRSAWAPNPPVHTPPMPSSAWLPWLVLSWARRFQPF